MFTVKITFGPCKPWETDKGYETENVAWDYLAKLVKNGQLCARSDEVEVRIDGELVFLVRIPRPNAYEKRVLSTWGRDSLAEVVAHFGREPEWTILDDKVPKRFPSWKSASSLYLFSSVAGPVHHGDHGNLVPTYLLRLSALQCEHLFFWNNLYHAIDDVWLDSGELEKAAYEQMANPESELSKDGRKLCKLVEKSTRKPTFYYIHRYGDEVEPEDIDKCPGCGQSWRTGIEGVWHQFAYRCVACRLVSNAPP